MRKSLTAIPLCLVIVSAVSVSSSVHAMPAPTPDNIELSIGLTQWGAETEAAAPLSMSNDEIRATLLELARPLPSGTSKAAICETLASAAQTHDLPVGFFVRLINQESGFNPEVVSHAGAQGVAQFMPRTAQEWGLKNPFDPHAALVASARFLRSLYDQLGNWGLAAAAYNGGLGRVQKWVAKGGKLPDETRNYVKIITGRSPETWADGKPQNAKFSIPPRAPCQDYAYLADAPDSDPTPAGSDPVQSATVMHAKSDASTPQSKAKVAITSIKRGMKVAVIKVAKTASKAATKVAVATGKRGKSAATVKVAEKSAKTAARAKDSKKPAKGRLQLADARGARK